jgi:hypothetical protein
MPRRLFEPQLGLRVSANGGLEPAAGSSFRVFTDFQAGVEVTDLKGSDGVSDLPKDINGAQFAMDSNGNVPYFRGPDTGTGAGETVLLFIDTGIGLRYPVLAVDALREAVQALGTVQAYIAANPSGGSTGGGLPADTDLDDIPDGTSRLAMTSGERLKLNTVPTTYVQVAGSGTATTAMRSDRSFTAAQVGAVANLGGVPAMLGRTAAQGMPTAAELAALPPGTYIAVDQA